MVVVRGEVGEGRNEEDGGGGRAKEQGGWWRPVRS